MEPYDCEVREDDVVVWRIHLPNSPPFASGRATGRYASRFVQVRDVQGFDLEYSNDGTFAVSWEAIQSITPSPLGTRLS